MNESGNSRLLAKDTQDVKVFLNQEMAKQVIDSFDSKVNAFVHQQFIDTKLDVVIAQTNKGVVAQLRSDYIKRNFTGIYISSFRNLSGNLDIKQDPRDPFHIRIIRAIKEFLVINSSISSLQEKTKKKDQITINDTLYVLFLDKNKNEIVFQRQLDIEKGLSSGLSIPIDNKMISFDGDENIIEYLTRLTSFINPIKQDFTSATSIEDQRKAHEVAKQYMATQLQAIGAEVSFSSPPKLQSPREHDVVVKKDLNPDVFCWDVTHGVQQDIQADGKANDDRTVLYGVASQFNGCESVGRFTPQPGTAVQAYIGDPTQGPGAQLQFPDEQVELINNAANLGYSGLCHVLSEKTKESVTHGYFTPRSGEAEDVIEELKSNGHRIEYPCIGNIPKGQGNEKKVYEILVAAPAFGNYNLQPYATREQQNEIQFLCALHGFRTQFQQAILLAQTTRKPVVFKPTGVGLGVYGNNSKIVAKAFYLAGKEFERQMKEHHIEVHFQVYQGTGQSKEFVDFLGIGPSQQFSFSNMKRLKFFLMKHHSGADSALTFQSEGVTYKAWFNLKVDAINIQKLDDFNFCLQNGKIGFHVNKDGSTKSVWIDGQPQKGRVPNSYFTY